MTHKTIPFQGVHYRNERGIHTVLSRSALHRSRFVYHGRKYGELTTAQKVDPLTNLSLHERITCRGRSLDLFAADVTLKRKRRQMVAYWMHGHCKDEKVGALSI